MTDTLRCATRTAPGSLRRRRRTVAAVSVVGAGLLGASLSAAPGSSRFYRLSMVVAGVWAAGGLASGPVPRSGVRASGRRPGHPVLGSVGLGATAFAGFYGAALVARRVPPLNRALRSVLRFADQGPMSLNLLTTLANGAAEEVFFRGALYAAAGDAPVLTSAAAYTLATVPTRNPALVLAAGVMGTVFGMQRRASGGVQAPLLTHLTWSALMIRFLPPLFTGGRPGALRVERPPVAR